jgi:hypothetical protein
MSATNTVRKSYLTPSEAARILGISEISLARLWRSNQIDTYRPTERVILFTHEMLERFRSQRTLRARAA